MSGDAYVAFLSMLSVIQPYAEDDVCGWQRTQQFRDGGLAICLAEPGRDIALKQHYFLALDLPRRRLFRQVTIANLPVLGLEPDQV